MDRLWAPWRMGYILGEEKPKGCIFCDFPARPREQHREVLVVHAEERAFVILNKFPYNNGHLMVVPRAHAASLAELSAEDNVALGILLQRSITVLQKAINPDGFNLGMNLGSVAGAGIAAHLHWHVVPRWNGDTNFMPVVGDVKVLSESLEASYDKLVSYFA